MKYIQYINLLLKDAVKKNDNLVLFGQNIDAGSCLSGLTSGLSKYNKGMTINTPNVENTLVGVGFGLMLNGVNSVFFMKQLDFLLLGIDHLVNTYNVIRQTQPSASFSIFPITVDSGYEGPQAALNNFDDFCSISGVEGFSFTNKIDSEKIINEYLFKPGFRILSTGQRYLKGPTLDLDVIYYDPEYRWFQYSKGESVSIVCFNHALSYGVELQKYLNEEGGSASLFSINSHLYSSYHYILQDVFNTKRLVIIDDSKSRNRLSDRFLIDALTHCKLKMKKVIAPELCKDIFYPRSDMLEISYNNIVNEILSTKI